MYMAVRECTHVCHMCAGAYGGPGFPELEFIGSCEPLYVSSGDQTQGCEPLNHLSSS